MARFGHADAGRLVLADVAVFTGSMPRIVADNLLAGVIKPPREGGVKFNDPYREMVGALFGAGAARTLATCGPPRMRVLQPVLVIEQDEATGLKPLRDIPAEPGGTRAAQNTTHVVPSERD
jgi:hypothetical protein